ncbi:response regulator transcription factor [Catenuloplanes japonicus]|uniref:response regulator transcription factor n=1 Tax=Catenuloplanes japonicus TaxID=33876 RepID=UPI0006896734|nr:response regulator [Catenuloplanes japonicus]
MDSDLVIIAEDDADLRDLLAMSVEGAGYRVECVRDGFTAVRRLEQTTPRALITDVRMPAMTGLELCRWVRQEPHLDTVRVVIVSAAVAPDDVSAGYAAGADDYLIKPFSPKFLRARLAALLQAPNAAPALDRPDSVDVNAARDLYLREARRNGHIF